MDARGGIWREVTLTGEGSDLPDGACGPLASYGSDASRGSTSASETGEVPEFLPFARDRASSVFALACSGFVAVLALLAVWLAGHVYARAGSAPTGTGAALLAGGFAAACLVWAAFAYSAWRLAFRGEAGVSLYREGLVVHDRGCLRHPEAIGRAEMVPHAADGRRRSAPDPRSIARFGPPHARVNQYLDMVRPSVFTHSRRLMIPRRFSGAVPPQPGRPVERLCFCFADSGDAERLAEWLWLGE